MHWSLIYLISEWSVRLIMLVYVPQRRSAAAARTWLLFIFLLPWPGLLVYGLFGRIYVPKRRIEQQQRASQRIRVVQEQMGGRSFAHPKLAVEAEAIEQYVARLGDFQAFGGNSIELLSEYAPAIERLIADIDAAE